MLVGSLFSGIGGLELGLERAGMKTIWQVEFNEYCQRVLRKHWKDTKIYGDITKVNFKTVEKVDLICGGFPCQPFSHAGKRKGVSDSRWLWPEFYRAIREVRPTWVVVENVQGLLSIDSGRVFIGILRNLNEIGYDAEWFTLRASDFGAPHRRERVFIVAHAKRGLSSFEWEEVSEVGGDVGNSESDTGETLGNVQEGQDSDTGGSDGDAPDTAEFSDRFAGRIQEGASSSELTGEISWRIPWIEVATRFCRVDDGLPVELDGFKLSKAGHRVERLKALGNAVVPQVAEHIGRMIMDYESNRIRKEDVKA
jgi:DNA (cytosine-5)-methyltransferase 1